MAIEAAPAAPTCRAITVANMLGNVFARCTKPKPLGVLTGVHVLDRLLGGLRPGRVCVLGAGTSWGKSSFAVQVSDVGLRAGAQILLVSGEDSEDTYGERFMARRARVNALELRDGLVTDPSALNRMAQVVEDGERKPYFLNGIGMQAEKLAPEIKKIANDFNVDLVIVDYLQAFGCARKQQDRRTEVSYIYRVFCDAIKLSGAAGLVLSQLKRMEPNERPTIASLKESGDIENGAEHVLLGWCTQHFEKGAPEGEKERWVCVGKNKDGPVVDQAIPMPFDYVTASFIEQKPPTPSKSRQADAQEEDDTCWPTTTS